MNKITPFLWYNDNAEEAMNFYISVFKEGKIININRQGDKMFTGTFELFGQRFEVLNGGPMFQFNEAISMFVSCNTQEEVDYYWQKLTEEGQESRCGWLKDKYGLSWQIIPTDLGRLLGDADREKAGRAMQAMLKMNKIVVADLQRAFNGE